MTSFAHLTFKDLTLPSTYVDSAGSARDSDLSRIPEEGKSLDRLILQIPLTMVLVYYCNMFELREKARKKTSFLLL